MFVCLHYDSNAQSKNIKMEQINVTPTTREKAIAWWNTLRDTRLNDGTKDKGYYTDKYFGYNMRMYQYLTGREVEVIWTKEIVS